jgi:4-hydroxy-2-oxoheptanedioate aldolase
MIKEKLKNQECVLGTWCEIPSPMLVNVLAKAGLDFVIVDMEHSVMNFSIAQDMIMAAGAEGKEAFVRVPGNNNSDILRALDCGSAGVIVPHVESAIDRDLVVTYSKFPPQGDRGFNPYIRSGGYHSVGKEYFSEQNKKTLLILIVEGQNGLMNLEAIVDHPDVDVIYVGTYDLSVALGVPGDVKNPKVLKTLEEMVKKIRAANKAAGCMIHSLEDLKYFKKIGIQFITFKTDTAIIYDAFKQMKEELDK